MDEYSEKLKEYLLQQRREGEPVEVTRRILIEHGWDAGMVDRAITQISPPRPPVSSYQLPEPLERAQRQLRGELDNRNAMSQPTATPAAEDREPQAYQPYGTEAHPPGRDQAMGMDQANRQQAATDAEEPVGNVLPNPSKHYGLLGGLADSILSLRRNLMPFISAAALCIIVSIFLFILTDKVVYGIVSLEVLTSDASSVVVFGTILLTSILAFLISLSAYSLIQFATNHVVSEGGDARKTTLQRIIADARGRLGKLLLTNFLVGLMAVGPILLVSNIYRAMNLAPLKVDGSDATANSLTLLIWLAVLAWIIVVILRYALAPIVAMFESDTSVIHSLRRSRQLLKGGGQKFIGKMLLLIFVASVFLLSVSGEQVRAFDTTDNPTVNGGLVVLAILINGILVMYYRNQRLLKET